MSLCYNIILKVIEYFQYFLLLEKFRCFGFDQHTGNRRQVEDEETL